MKTTNTRHIGDFKIDLLNDEEFQEDFPIWMSRVAEELAQETLEDTLDKKSKYPHSFFADGCVSFEVSVSISTFPKSNEDENNRTD